MPPTPAHNPFIGPNPLSAIDNTIPVDNTPKVKIGYNGLSTEGSFLLDTGAAASMISTSLADELHVEVVTDSSGTYLTYNGTRIADQFNLQIGGIGGSGAENVPGFFLDSLLLRTMEGDPANDDDPNHLRFLHAPVLVEDITVTDALGNSLTLDGILGMNFFTASSGVTDAGSGDALDLGSTLDLDSLSPSPFDWLTFDEPNGVLGLQLVAQAVP